MSQHPIKEQDLKYLEDLKIVQTLIKLDKAVSVWQSGRMKNNYAEMCFAVGMMRACGDTLYRRNAEIDEESRPAKDEAPEAPPPPLDVLGSACEAVRQTHNAPEPPSIPNGRTHPAILARTEPISDQELDEAVKDYLGPS